MTKPVNNADVETIIPSHGGWGEDSTFRLFDDVRMLVSPPAIPGLCLGPICVGPLMVRVGRQMIVYSCGMTDVDHVGQAGYE